MTNKNAALAELHAGNEQAMSWNPGFPRGFHDWEISEVDELYLKVENQRLAAVVEDEIVWDQSRIEFLR